MDRGPDVVILPTKLDRAGTVGRRSLIRAEQVAVAVLLSIYVVVSIPAFLASPGDTAIGIGLTATYALTGVLLALRRPRNPIGWIFLTILLILGLTGAADATGGGAVVAGGPLPGGIALVLIWFESWAFPVIFSLVFAVTIVFPSGHLPGNRSGRAARMAFVAIPPGIAVIAFGPYLAGVYSQAHVPNPFALLAIPDRLWTIPYLMSIVFLVAGAISIVVRFQRARGAVRQQLKWVVAALALTTVLIVGTLTVVLFLESEGARPGTGPWSLAAIGFALIPLAVAIAVLRHRLYEIDRIVSRTIGWAVLTVILAGVFIVLILSLQALAAPVTGSNTVAVALSTLVVAALFQPLRRRIQRLVDRRFNRARYDAEQTVARFGARVRDEVDLEILNAALVDGAVTSLQPSWSAIWIRPRS